MVIGMFAYMEAHNTQMLVFENSDTLDEETSEQSKEQTYLDSIMHEIKSMGLVPIPVLCFLAAHKVVGGGTSSLPRLWQPSISTLASGLVRMYFNSLHNDCHAV